jgi:chromosomal replication initiation ATPase DnaA
MTEKPRQIPLDLPVAERLEAEDFLVSPSNEAAFNRIEAWPEWLDPILVLIGPESSGKSHLAAIWAVKARAWTIKASDITMDRVPHLVSNGALVIEDADQGVDEHAMFHLLNASREKRGFVVITARKMPDLWGLKTPDLLSRLRLAPSVSIEQPDEALLQAVLVKLFVDRQLVVDTALIGTLTKRIDRSIAAARRAVEQLDKEALAQGRRVNRGLALDLFRETLAEPNETEAS